MNKLTLLIIDYVMKGFIIFLTAFTAISFLALMYKLYKHGINF